MNNHEILFRGKRFDGVWSESHYPFGEIHSGVLFYEFKPETIGQYTGHQDKNDKRIFEGDICRDGDCIVVVEWMRYGWSCRVLKGCALALGMAFPLWQWDNCPENGNRKLEVIGNIHDNPELLEK